MTSKKCNCPNIDAADWDSKEFEWENKTFYFLPINCVLNKPLGLEEKVRDLRKEIVAKSYEFTDFPPVICEWAPFKSRVLTEIKNPQEYDENIYVFDMGTIYTTVYQGSAKEFKRAVNEFTSQIELNHGVPAQKVFIWYVHCKNCAKQKSNQAVIFVKT